MVCITIHPKVKVSEVHSNCIFKINLFFKIIGKAKTIGHKSELSIMSTEAISSDVRSKISLFLTRNFPQIAMHGGDAAIEEINLETGEVWIRLGGMCSGCGISPMTIQAIRHRLVMEIPEINEVYATSGGGYDFDPFGHQEEEEDFPDVPF
jgi:Fe-S cluster biogenesis protein NfuA